MAYKYLDNAATHSVYTTALDVHSTNIARSASWDARAIRARRSESFKATNKIRKSVFTGSFLSQNSSNMYHNFSADL